MRKLLLLLTLCCPLAAQTVSGVMSPVTMKAFDNARTGMNTQESVLTPQSITARGLRKYFDLPMEGDARGTESQILFQPSVTMEDGNKRDVAIVTAMNNLVYAFDANNSDILWVKKLGVPANGSRAIDMHLINDHWGILNTGVIDPATNYLYQLAEISKDGTPQNSTYYMFVLDLRTGALVKPPAPMANLTYQPIGGTLQKFNSTMRKCRSAEAFINNGGTKTVFGACGTVLETSSGAAGVVYAYDVATNSFSMMTLTAGDGAGMWMAGGGLVSEVVNGTVYLYGVTGNGSFNGTDNLGESVVKISYTTPGSLKTVDHWTPYTDEGRTGGLVTGGLQMRHVTDKLSGVSLPSEQVKDEMPMPVNGMRAPDTTNVVVKDNGVAKLYYPVKATDNAAWSDEDLGSGGMPAILSLRAVLASGKDGIGYLVNMDNMGNTQPKDFLNASANCAKLLGPPVWMTESPGPVNACPQDPTTLNFMPWGKTRHMHMTPVVYTAPNGSVYVFAWGENSQLHKWQVTKTGLTYVAEGNEVASANCGTNGEECQSSPGGMPGGFCTGASNAGNNAIIACTIPYGDANAEVTYGRLLIYDAQNLGADGNLKVLWDSQAQAIPFIYNKFDPPVINGGKIFLPTYDDQVIVFGLAN